MIRLLINDRTGARVASVPRWAVWLGVAAAGCVGLLVAVIGFSLLLLLAPVVLVAGALARWRLRKALREMQATRPARPDPFGRNAAGSDVIDAEYRMIDQR